MTDWFNENMYRAFPFITRTVGVLGAAAGTIEALPNTAIVEAGFITGLRADFDHALDVIRLSSVTRIGDVLYFDFVSTAPGLEGRRLTFSRNIEDAKYVTEYAEDTDAVSYTSEGLYPLPEPAGDEPLWRGYLVTGDLRDLVALLPGDGAITGSTGGVVEPALIQRLDSGYVSSISIANQDRTRVGAAQGCSGPTWDFPTGATVLYAQSYFITGDIRWTAGYNCDVQQDDNNNAIVLAAAVGAGAGEPCGEATLFDGETPATGEYLMSGGPRCSDVVRAINGVSGQFSFILPGLGVELTESPSAHALGINVNMSRLAVCTSEISETT
jgi:hypothetical protein